MRKPSTHGADNRNLEGPGIRVEENSKNPTLLEKWTKTAPNDMHVYSDDLAIKTKMTQEIYPKLTTFGKCIQEYTININWDKIKIIINETEYTIRAMRAKLPAEYKNIQFPPREPYLGNK